MNKRDFDCVEMKRRGSRRVYEAIRGMTVKQEVAFWHQRTAEFRREIRERKGAKSERAATG